MKDTPYLMPEKTKEDRHFNDRLRFDQSKFWDWNSPTEIRSRPPSTWPALVEAVQKWGLPVREINIGRYGR